MRQKTVLSHKDAMLILNAILQRAEAEEAGLCAAVVDEQGTLLAFVRTDGSPLASITIAQNKAYTAARERIPSKTLGERSASEGFPMTNFGELRYVTWGGGLPLLHEGQVIGAVGVSGLPEAVDLDYAEMGIAAWRDSQ